MNSPRLNPAATTGSRSNALTVGGLMVVATAASAAANAAVVLRRP